MTQSNATRNTHVDAIKVLFNSGTIRIYSGAAPATPQDAATGTLLATVTMPSTAFGANDGTGGATANAISAVMAGNSGTAGYARAVKSDGTTVIMDLTVGTSGADFNINALAIAAGASVSVTSFTLQSPA
jgi:hypothetical protein